MRQILSVLFLGFFILVTQQSMALDILDLKKALGYALEDNTVIKSKEFMKDAGSLTKKASDGAYLPKVGIVQNLQRTDNPPMVFTHKLSQRTFGASDLQLERLNNPDPMTNWHTELILEQPVFNQGKEIIERKKGVLNEGLSELHWRYTKELISFQVAESFFKILSLEQELKVLEQTLKEAEEAVRLAEERHKRGLGLYSDVLSATTRKAGVETKLANTKANRADLVRRLNHLMGQAQEKDWRFLDSDCIKPPADLGQVQLDTLIEYAKSHRPDILILEHELSLEQLNKESARFAFLPSLNLYCKYAWDTASFLEGANSYEMGFVLNFNLFNGLSDTYRYKAAKKAFMAKELSLKELKELVEVELHEALSALESSMREYSLSCQDIKRAQEALRILKARYQEGLALFIEVLNGQVMVEESLLKKAKSYYATKIALVRLKFLSGKILEVTGECNN